MDKKNKESGMLIVEATIVFPVMFLVIFLMIFTGNAYFQKCRIDSFVTQLAIEGASYCADPILEDVVDGGVPALTEFSVYPYRYFDPDGAADIKSTLEAKIQSKVNNLGTGLFSGMKPVNQTVAVEYHNGFIYSTFSVSVQYKIIMPIKLLWSSENLSMSFASYANMPVSDSTEFMRNINMAQDYMDKFGVTDAINDAKAKLTEALGKAKEWFNK